MTDRDLTPAEARTEVETFMGRGWTCNVWQGVLGEYQCDATTGRIAIRGSGITYRAAVSALKQAWRDAVRPWVDNTLAEVDISSSETLRIKAIVLGEEA